MKDHEYKRKEGDVVIIHGDKRSSTLQSVAKVKKVLLSKGNKVWSATMKYFINGKTVVINTPIYNFYAIQPVKQTSEDNRPMFNDHKNFCQIETS